METELAVHVRLPQPADHDLPEDQAEQRRCEQEGSGSGELTHRDRLQRWFERRGGSCESPVSASR
jgi:hypothetical protein